MPSEVLPGTSFPKFTQLLFDLVGIASCKHRIQAKFSGSCNLCQWSGCHTTRRRFCEIFGIVTFETLRGTTTYHKSSIIVWGHRFGLED